MLAPSLTTVSALITTYAGESAEHLQASLDSLMHQTLLPDQIVVVIDGPIDTAQRNVIAHFSTIKTNSQITILDLPQNGGLAKALNHGLKACAGDYIMRMDSDDLSLTDRLMIEKSYLDSHPDIDLVASWSSEFIDEAQDLRLKTSPTEHDAIIEALKWRNVIAHPTILVRKSKLDAIGGYREAVGLLEDYDLYVRLIMNGAKFHIIPKILLRVRTTQKQRARRGNFAYFINETKFRYHCFRIGFLSTKEFFLTTGLYALFRLIGTPLRNRLYATVRI
jgi:glycosyltransferase involved in cell wall biosynthesis